jgi:hypothetical protein
LIGLREGTQGGKAFMNDGEIDRDDQQDLNLRSGALDDSRIRIRGKNV